MADNEDGQSSLLVHANSDPHLERVLEERKRLKIALLESLHAPSVPLSAEEKTIRSSLTVSLFSESPLPTKESAVLARRVFNIPELFEEIMANLNLHDPLSAPQTTKSMQAVFKKFPKLQDKMPIKKNLSKPAYTPFEEGAFSHIDVTLTEQMHSVDDLEIVVRVHHISGKELPRIGPRLSKVLLCQPPVTYLRTKPRCCTKRGTGAVIPGYHVTNIRSEKGITVGQLFDHVRRIRGEHRFCHNANIGLMEADGTYIPDISYEGFVNLDEDNPTYKARCKARDKENQENEALKASMMPYYRAKNNAFHNKQPIQTFEELQARAAEESSKM